MAKTKIKDKKSLANQLNKIPSEENTANIQKSTDLPAEETNEEYHNRIFDQWDETVPGWRDFQTEIPIDSLESQVGYSSLFRQMHQSFVRTVAFYRSEVGGSLTSEEARKAAFHAVTDREEARKIFHDMMRLPLESLNFVDLMKLQSYSPRVAESFWEIAKIEGRAEFESGHLAANISFPLGYMKQVWNIARYMGVRASFIDDWKPKGGIEIALVDMLAQSWFQWQYWIEQTVKRSTTEPRREDRRFAEWKEWNKQAQKQWNSGSWDIPYVSEDRALEQAIQMADRFNRIFLRTLRQLRDLRRYSPVIINNSGQVNVAADGGQQVNVSKPDEEKTKSIKN
jgi:hypothetical protein